MEKKLSDSDALLSYLANVLAEAQDGASFKGFSSTVASAFLQTVWLDRTDLSEYQSRQVCAAAPFEAAKSGRVTKASLLSALDHLILEQRRKQRVGYRFRTALSLRGSTVKWRPKHRGGVIIRRVEGWDYIAQNEQFRRDIEQYIPLGVPSFLTPVELTVDGPDVNSAAELALHQLDVLRGIWNLLLNSVPILRSGPRSAYSEVRRAPLVTVHDPAGRRTQDEFWYDEQFARFEAKSVTAAEWIAISDYERRVQAFLKRSKYRTELETALSRYAQALDTADPHLALLRLWGILEYTTSTTTENSRQTVRRASFVFKDAHSVQITLLALRDYRNRVVHAAHEGLQIDVLLYQMHMIVQKVLRWQIATASLFGSLIECGEFMNLPQDIRQINKVRRHHEMARQFLVKGTLGRKRQRSPVPGPAHELPKA